MKKILDLLVELHPEYDFLGSQDFLEDGYLDSFDIANLIEKIETTYNIELQPKDVIPENFLNLEALYNLLGNYGISNDV